MREGSGTALGVAVGVVVFLILLPFLLVVALYTFFTIYAMTKGTAFGADTIDLSVLFTGLVAVVAALVLVLMGALSFTGRFLNPPKRRRRDT